VQPQTALGRAVRAERVPLIDYAPAGSLLENPYSAEGFRQLRDYYDHHGFHGGNSLVLNAILGRVPNDFAAFVQTTIIDR